MDTDSSIKLMCLDGEHFVLYDWANPGIQERTKLISYGKT